MSLENANNEGYTMVAIYTVISLGILGVLYYILYYNKSNKKHHTVVETGDHNSFGDAEIICENGNCTEYV